jgi:hypothetical protein
MIASMPQKPRQRQPFLPVLMAIPPSCVKAMPTIETSHRTLTPTPRRHLGLLLPGVPFLLVGLAAIRLGAQTPLPAAPESYLKASNTGEWDLLGISVAMAGDTMVVGAPGEGSNAAGVNGSQSNDSAPGAGAAYVFVRLGTNWQQQAYLKASNPEAGDNFGHAVAISDHTIVIGAPNESSSATGVNGDPSNNSAPGSGAAYVFVRSGTNWVQQAYLKASNTGSADYFGTAVTIADDTVVIGASQERSAASGVNGNQHDDSAFAAGAAYVFVRNGTNWTQQAYLKASNTDGEDLFGASLSVEGNTVVVGAYQEASNAIGVNGNQSNNSAYQAGAA